MAAGCNFMHAKYRHIAGVTLAGTISRMTNEPGSCYAQHGTADNITRIVSAGIDSTVSDQRGPGEQHRPCARPGATQSPRDGAYRKSLVKQDPHALSADRRKCNLCVWRMLAP
jgi:hypothetical protein